MSLHSMQPVVLRVNLDAALLSQPRSVSELAADPALGAFWSDGSSGLPIDVAVPDEPEDVPWLTVPVLGDPFPRHLFMRSLEWPEPLPPVLRPDRPYCPIAHAVQLGLLPPGCLPDAQWPRFVVPAEFLVPTSPEPEPEPEPVPTWVFILGSAAIWAASAGAVGYLLHRLFS